MENKKITNILAAEKDKRFAKHIVEIVSHAMLAKGHISESDLKDRDSLFEKLKNLATNAKYEIVIDHRDSILQTAERFNSTAQYDFATIFFAMYFEHTINHLITHQIEKKKISIKTKLELIRSVKIEGKFSWLLELLGMPVFNENHRKKIIAVSNERNAFIHYKWNVAPEFPLKIEREKARNFLVDIRKTVIYMKKYETRVLYMKNKMKLKVLLDKKPKL